MPLSPAQQRVAALPRHVRPATSNKRYQTENAALVYGSTGKERHPRAITSASSTFTSLSLYELGVFTAYLAQLHALGLTFFFVNVNRTLSDQLR